MDSTMDFFYIHHVLEHMCIIKQLNPVNGHIT